MGTVKVTEIILQNSNQIKQSEQRLKIDHKAILKSFINNEWKHKNGISMLQYGIYKYIRVSVIPRYKFNKYNRRWIKEYMVQSMEEAITYKEFIERNKQFIITGKQNIIKAIRRHQEKI